MATMVMRMRLNVMLHVQCLYCLPLTASNSSLLGHETMSRGKHQHFTRTCRLHFQDPAFQVFSELLATVDYCTCKLHVQRHNLK